MLDCSESDLANKSDCVYSPNRTGSNVSTGQKVEGSILAAVGRLKFVPKAELPLVLQLQSDDGLTQGTSVLTNHAEGGACVGRAGVRTGANVAIFALTIKTACTRITFQKAEPLEESRDNEGVTEVKQKATEHQTLVVKVGGVWTRVDVAHRNLRQKMIFYPRHVSKLMRT